MINNGILILLSIFFIYGLVLIWFYFFGYKGLLGFTVFATIAANLEVLLVIEAFNIEQTLGNVLFGSTFLATDILSELYGKEKSKSAVYIGLLTTISFILISKSWLYYTPKYDDAIYESFKTIFSSTPRIMLSSLLVYAISQILDVYIYHKIWKFTEKTSGSKSKFLWFRNNGSTLISQLVNSFLFTLLAFYGTYDIKTLFNIFISSYFIFVLVSILDTPIIYIARYLFNKKLILNK